MEVKGVRSVPSRVDNLQVLTKAITHETFTQAVIEQFKSTLGWSLLQVRIQNHYFGTSAEAMLRQCT
jgi:lipoate-protein ligase A